MGRRLETGELLHAALGEGGDFAIGVAARIDDAPSAAAWRPDAREEPTFLVYSINKTLLAAVALLLVEDGRLALESTLARFEPAVPGASRITVEQLLRHTAGIPNYGALPAYHEAVRAHPEAPWSHDEFAAHTWKHGLHFEPGARFEYSNPGYMLVRAIVERAGVSSDESERDVRDCYHPGWVSHGVVASTASEITTFAQAFFGGKLVNTESLRRATALGPVRDAPPQWREPGYGLGVMGDRASPFGPIFGHNGGGPGYAASVFSAPVLRGRRVTVCALCSSEADDAAERLVFEVLAAVERRL